MGDSIKHQHGRHWQLRIARAEHQHGFVLFYGHEGLIHFPVTALHARDIQFKVLIDPKAIMYIIGTNMDFVEEKMKSGFVFVNPNEKGRCGCGESFNV